MPLGLVRFLRQEHQKFIPVFTKMLNKILWFMECMDILKILHPTLSLWMVLTHLLLDGHMMEIQFMVHLDIKKQIMFNLVLLDLKLDMNWKPILLLIDHPLLNQDSSKKIICIPIVVILMFIMVDSARLPSFQMEFMHTLLELQLVDKTLQNLHLHTHTLLEINLSLK